jgi:hypothetical protein
LPGISKLRVVTVGIETLLGARYVFPDVDETFARTVIGKLGTGDVPGDLHFVNVSSACLVLPRRIIQNVTLNEEVVWKHL